jgi:tol-pal system protein YbgF
MRSKLYKCSMLALVFALVVATSGAVDQKDKEAQLKLALDEVRNELVVLERQVRGMQESMDKNAGQVNTLITQLLDNVTAIKQAQGRVAESAISAITEVNGIGERIGSTNSRIDRMSEQLAELKKLVENMPKLPTFTQISPGNPDQLFAAAYGDFSRGNYELAMSEFRQYLETYPSTEMSDNAQYWIGECFYAMKKYGEAVTEFDKVVKSFPKGDKVPAARLKKGIALKELGQPDAARLELSALIRLYPRSTEALLAQQELEKQ